MVKVRAISLALLVSSMATATNAQSAEQFLQGGWITGPAAPNTAISAGLATGPTAPTRLFQLSSAYFVDAKPVEHMLSTERGDASASLYESSGAFVEGVNVEIRQTAPGTVMGGQWVVANQPAAFNAFAKTSWTADANKLHEIANFAKPRYFVLSFNSKPKDCSDGVLKVMVDGRVLKSRAGAELGFMNMSSVLSYGSRISVIIAGTCQAPSMDPGQNPTYSGSLKTTFDPS